jgi:alkylation response protein AidB-like acyl-CoA dehydrogenase
MSLILTEEQKMLKDSAREFLLANSPLDSFRTLRDNDYKPYDYDVWKGFVEMGWTALIIPEKYGGLNFGYTGLGQIIEESGRTLTKSPIISSILLSSSAIILSDNCELKEKWLPKLMNASKLMSFALDEKSVFDPKSIKSIVVESGKNYILNADKKMVINGNNSDFYIVVANLNNSVSLFLVDSCSEGIDIKTDVLMDAGSYSSIKFKNVLIPKKNKLDIKVEGVNILNKILDIASIGLSCEMLGSVQAAFEQTINYLKERQQFGKKIGSYQALQHRIADLFCEIELCKSIVLKSLQAIDSGDKEITKLAHLAKAKLGEVIKRTSNEAIQMHGGIGVTDDVNIGFYLKRARVVQHLFGDTNYHLNALAKIKGY